MECPEAADKLVEGDTIEVDIREGVIVRQSDHAQFQAEPLSELMREIVNVGGLVEYVKAQALKAESGLLASKVKDSRSK
jgi:3-isopropylmalate/(R)-2-methylmalate dehydratase small subunit